jgi:hypothetical protein
MQMSEIKLTKEQQAAIAEELAAYFFDYWQRHTTNPTAKTVDKKLTLKPHD